MFLGKRTNGGTRLSWVAGGISRASPFVLAAKRRRARRRAARGLVRSRVAARQLRRLTQAKYSAQVSRRESKGERPVDHSDTCVDSNPELQLMIWQMTHSEEEHVTKQFQGHTRDLSCVFDAIQLRTTADHSVCITNSLDLKDNVIC